MGVNHINFFGEDLINLRPLSVQSRSLLKGVTAVDCHGEIIEGTIPTNGSSNVTRKPDGTVGIPEGYYPYYFEIRPASVTLAVPEIVINNDGTIDVNLKQKAGYVQGQTLTKRASIPKEVILNMSYPVGSVYMSFDATDPGQLFGGTWERIKDTFLLAAGDTYEAGSEGGEAQHLLTIDEMPSHNHNFKTKPSASAAGTAYSRMASNGDETTTLITNAGGDKPHNNMPPYIAVYMWKRTA